jgi:hypothetical protein
MTKVTDEDRVALLVEGIALLAAEEHRVCVTGADDDRVRRAVATRLGVDARTVRVYGDVPREVRPRPCFGYMEREEGRVELRCVLSGEQHITDIAVAEDEETVVVLGSVCISPIGDPGELVECPAHVYLRRPLGDRRVIDGFSGKPVPYKNVYVELQRRMNGEA